MNERKVKKDKATIGEILVLVVCFIIIAATMVWMGYGLLPK